MDECISVSCSHGCKLWQKTHSANQVFFFLSLGQDLKLFFQEINSKQLLLTQEWNLRGHFESRHTCRMSSLRVKRREHHRRHQHIYDAHKQIILRTWDNGLECARSLSPMNKSSHFFSPFQGLRFQNVCLESIWGEFVSFSLWFWQRRHSPLRITQKFTFWTLS